MQNIRGLVKIFAISSVVFLLTACNGTTGGIQGGSTGDGNGGGTPSITDAVTVDPTSVLSDTVRHPIGVNTDWIDDNQQWRSSGAPTLQTALGNMGVKYLRYPGGEEGNLYLWSTAPYTSPVSTLALPGPDRPYNTPSVVTNSTTPINAYDFDQFMADCKAINCTPNIMVTLRPYLASPMPNDPVPTRQDLIDSAAAWVRYANITKGYGIKQWEIGNEYDVDNTSGLGTGPSESTDQYIQDVQDFSTAMKAVDPTIQIGAFGWTEAEFLPILQADAQYIDFLVVHSYPFGLTSSGTTYPQYQGMTTISGLESSINAALSALADPSISAADKARIKISLTEINGTLQGDNNANNLFDAVGLTDILGETLTHPQINYVEVWTDHWYDTLNPTPDGWNALDNANNITPKGRAIAIWGQFLLEQMVEANVTSPDAMVRTYATYNQHNGNLNIILLNKDSNPHTANVSLQNYNVSTDSSASQWVLSGSGQSDTSPTFTEGSAVPVNAGTVSVNLPGPSVVVLTLQGASTSGLNLIADPGFEDPDLSAWTMSYDSTPTLTPVSHSGMQALQVPSGMGVYQDISLAGMDGQSCTVGGWGMLSAASSSGQAQFGIGGTLNGQAWNEVVNFTATSYTYLSQQFTLPSGLQSPDIWVWNGAGSNLLLDDLVLNCH